MKCIEHKVIEYLCDDCGEPLGNHEGNPYISDGNNNYCYDCALKHRLIDADEWLFAHGFTITRYLRTEKLSPTKSGGKDFEETW